MTVLHVQGKGAGMPFNMEITLDGILFTLNQNTVFLDCLVVVQPYAEVCQCFIFP